MTEKALERFRAIAKELKELKLLLAEISAYENMGLSESEAVKATYARRNS